MDGLKVSELARRSGVPASTVRFYDREGLLPARRSPSGYRLFDEVALDRLAFIGTAKGLGLLLPEIRTLLGTWQDGACSDVAHELLPLVARRLAETRDRRRELDASAARLDRAHAQLETLERPGPCDTSCTLLGRDADPVLACSLDATDHERRVQQWREVLDGVVERVAIPHGVSLVLDARTRPAELAELAAAEVACCPFLELTLHLGPPRRLDARAPAEALALVHELFGARDATA